MDNSKYARLNFRLSREEFDALDQVIERLNYESKTQWLKAHLRADCIACGFVELNTTERTEKALQSVGEL
jgi:hypothetical protein